MSDDFEPIPGLPESLPEGERILWQGAPDWATLARRAFHVNKVACYFAILMLWEFGTRLYDGAAVQTAAIAGLWMVGLGAIAITVLSVLALVFARTTIYTITNRRIVFRFGVALPMTINLPFNVIDSAAVREHGGGIGDLPVALIDNERVGYFIFWPNVKPWAFARPEPMLRAVPDVEQAATVLARALADFNQQPAQAKPAGETVPHGDGSAAETAAA